MSERVKITLLLVAIFVVYHANVREFSSGDVTGNSLLPLSLLRDGDLYLDEFELRVHHRRWEIHDGHVVSRYPILPGLLALPVYALGTALGIDRLGIDAPHGPLGGVLWPGVRFLGKLTASLFTIVSVYFVYAALRHRVGARAARAIATVYALGTATWTISSQGLWLHGCCQMMVAGALFCISKTDGDSARMATAGTLASLAAATRVLTGILLPAFVLAEWQRRRRFPWSLLVGPGLVFPVWIAYNLVFFDSLFGGQTNMMRDVSGSDSGLALFHMPILAGLTGLMFSPGRGLLTLSPVLLLAVPPMLSALWKRDDPLHGWLAIGVLLFIGVLAKASFWHGGFCYCSRYTADILPVLAFFLALAAARTRRPRLWWVVFSLLSSVSIAVQAIGAFYYPADPAPRPARLWSLRNSEVARCLRQAPYLVRHPEESFLSSLRPRSSARDSNALGGNPSAIDDRPQRRAHRQGPIGVARVSGEPRRAERVRDGPVGVTH